jgi:hypothetical protein
MVASFYITINREQGFSFFTSSPTLTFCLLVVILMGASQCLLLTLICIFLLWLLMFSIFSSAFWPSCVCCLWRITYSVAHFLIRLLFFFCWFI